MDVFKDVNVSKVRYVRDVNRDVYRDVRVYSSL